MSPRYRGGRPKSSSSLLIVGTTSGVGKTTVVMVRCPRLSRQGISVPPFKAQRMPFNSFVRVDTAEREDGPRSSRHEGRALIPR